MSDGIAPGDPRYDGFRITELWAWVAVDPADNQEGVCGFLSGDGWLPMIAADERRVRSLRPQAEAIAASSGRTIRLARFTVREDVEELT